MRIMASDRIPVLALEYRLVGMLDGERSGSRNRFRMSLILEVDDDDDVDENIRKGFFVCIFNTSVTLT